MTAIVVHIDKIEPHPDADRLELVNLTNGVQIVSGPHYELGCIGVYIPAGQTIPGWLAEDLWMVKKGNVSVDVEPRMIRGVLSPGVFAGAVFRNAPDRPWQQWPMWRERFKEGDDLSEYLGVRPHASRSDAPDSGYGPECNEHVPGCVAAGPTGSAYHRIHRDHLGVRIDLAEHEYVKEERDGRTD